MGESKQAGISTGGGRPGISIKIEGPRVGEARLSGSDLAIILHRSQQALKRIGQALYGDSSVGKGRKKKDIEDLCEIFIIGWNPGSAIAEIELAKPPSQMNFLGYIGEESLKSFLNGIQSIQTGSPEDKHVLPAGFDAGVLQTCDSLGRVLDHGIDSVRFDPRRVTAVAPVTFDRPLREKVRELLSRPIDQRQMEKVGRLEVLDGHQRLQGRLWEADGTRWLCIFKPEHLEILPDAWLRTVKIIGEAVVEPTRERMLKVEFVLPLEEEIEASTLSIEEAKLPFWTSVPLEELAELQGVQPAEELDSISALWPADDDPDEMLTHILDERSSRRGIAREGEG